VERQFTKEIESLRLGDDATFHGEGILAVTKALLQSGVSYVSSKTRAGAIHHDTPARYHHSIFLKGADFSICRIYFCQQFLVFIPAAKMYKGKKNKKTPGIPK